MNIPINIDELTAIKIYPSKERALDGTRISDLTALLWKMEDDAMSRPLDSPMPAGWYCDISPSGLDKWAEQAHKRVMESVDLIIADYVAEREMERCWELERQNLRRFYNTGFF